MVEVNGQVNTLRSCSMRMLKFVRILYLVIAVVITCNACFKSIRKMKEANVLSNEETRVLDHMRYPSITFCYKYKHGSKRAEENYLPYLFENGKHEGNKVSFIHKLYLSTSILPYLFAVQQRTLKNNINVIVSQNVYWNTQSNLEVTLSDMLDLVM